MEQLNSTYDQLHNAIESNRHTGEDQVQNVKKMALKAV